MYKLMILSATEQYKEQFYSLISEVMETPTALIVTSKDTVAIEWANFQSPAIPCITIDPEPELYGRTADFKNIADRIADADAVLLLGDIKYKKYTQALKYAEKAELPVYRI